MTDINIALTGIICCLLLVLRIQHESLKNANEIIDDLYRKIHPNNKTNN